jgi:Uma2 family endonuclease
MKKMQPPGISDTIAPHAPPLESGDRLSREEFLHRYARHPEIKKAEFIKGVGYVASPVRYRQHGRWHSDIITWMGVYRAATPGVFCADNTTLELDTEHIVQPDAVLRLDDTLGGRSSVTPDDYLTGAPELVIEIAASSASYDMHDKYHAYAHNGVQEYLAVQVYEQRLAWFTLHAGAYQPLQADSRGILRSTVFPGLWLDPAAFLRGDMAAVLAVLQEGLATSDHMAFVERLQKQ